MLESLAIPIIQAPMVGGSSFEMALAVSQAGGLGSLGAGAMAPDEIEAQANESISVGGKNYSTVRYEAFVFDDVLYKRKGRLLMWMTDDSEHLPVQFRLLLGFPIGTITVQLDKQQKT